MISLPRWALALLALSLTINLLGIGYLFGSRMAAVPTPALHDTELHVLRGPGQDQTLAPLGIPGAEVQGLRWIAQGLPAERRGDIEMRIEQLQAPLLEEAADVRRLREAVRRALTDEPFDPERLRAALEQLRHHLLQTQQGSHSVLVEIATAMQPEERAALAQRFATYLLPAPPRTLNLRIERSIDHDIDSRRP